MNAYVILQLNTHGHISGDLRHHDFVHAKITPTIDDPYFHNINRNGWRRSHKPVYRFFKLELIK